ncbi:MAG: tachylectin-related carbohydrate-binding protein [Planctomycetota bacterium]
MLRTLPVLLLVPLVLALPVSLARADSAVHNDKLVSAGWDAFVHIAGGRDGVIYAVTTTGEIRLHRHNVASAGPSWQPVLVLGNKGWHNHRAVFGGDDGVLYLVDAAGDLYITIDKHTTSADGKTATPNWSEPAKINPPRWNPRFARVVGGHNGIIYAFDPAGRLFWFRDLSRNGTANWDRNCGALIGDLGRTAVYPDITAIGGGTNGVLWAVMKNGNLQSITDSARNGTGTVEVKLVTPGRTGINAVAAGGNLIYKRSTDGKLWFTEISGGGFVRAGNTLTAPGKQFSVSGTITDGPDGAGPGTLSLSGSVTIETPAGTWVLDEASLQVDMSSRPFISGRAKCSVPEIGVLRDLIKPVAKAEAQISVGYGGAFEIKLGDGSDERQFPTDPTKLYLYAAFAGEAKAKIVAPGGAEFGFGGGTKLVIEPTQPILYADHQFAQKLLEAVGIVGWQQPVIGFSLGPPIRHTLANRLLKATRDGEEIVRVDGNLLVKGACTIPLKGATLDLDGALVVDLDVDGDGALCLRGGRERTDWAFGGDLHGVLTIKVKNRDVPLELGKLSLLASGDGRFRFHGYTGKPDYFAGTPLAAWKTGTASTKVLADISANDLWVQISYNSISIAGWTLGSATATFSPADLAINATLDLAPGEQGATLAVTGKLVYAEGNATLQGTGDITFGGVKFASTTAKLTLGEIWSASATASVSVAAKLSMFGSSVDLSGNASSNGDWKLGGRAELTVKSGDIVLELAGATITAGTKGVSFKASTSYASAGFAISGSWKSSSKWSFKGTCAASGKRGISFKGAAASVSASGKVHLSVDDDGFSAKMKGSANLTAAGLKLFEIDLNHRVSASGKITFTIGGVDIADLKVIPAD